MNQCTECGGSMIGDGYSSVMHCEFAEPETYEFHEADSNPVMCVYDEDNQADDILLGHLLDTKPIKVNK